MHHYLCVLASEKLALISNDSALQHRGVHTCRRSIGIERIEHRRPFLHFLRLTRTRGCEFQVCLGC